MLRLYTTWPMWTPAHWTSHSKIIIINMESSSSTPISTNHFCIDLPQTVATKLKTQQWSSCPEHWTPFKNIGQRTEYPKTKLTLPWTWSNIQYQDQTNYATSWWNKLNSKGRFAINTWYNLPLSCPFKAYTLDSGVHKASKCVFNKLWTDHIAYILYATVQYLSNMWRT